MTRNDKMRWGMTRNERGYDVVDVDYVDVITYLDPSSLPRYLPSARPRSSPFLSPFAIHLPCSFDFTFPFPFLCLLVKF